MNSTFKTFVSALALGLVATLPGLRAQDAATPPPAPAPEAKADADRPPPGRRGQNPQQMVQMMKERLSLTDDQVTKLQAIVKDQREKVMALRNDQSLSQDDRRTKAMDLMKDSRAQIRALLTPDQQKIFDAMPPMGGPRGKKGRNGDAPPSPPPPPST